MNKISIIIIFALALTVNSKTLRYKRDDDGLDIAINSEETPEEHNAEFEINPLLVTGDVESRFNAAVNKGFEKPNKGFQKPKPCRNKPCFTTNPPTPTTLPPITNPTTVSTKPTEATTQSPITNPTASTVTPLTTETMPTSTSGTTKEPIGEQAKCLKGCMVSIESDPVCGSDGITYPNPAFLNCANKCGFNVQMVSKGACPKDPVTSPPPTTPTTGLDQATQDCIHRCPVLTPEYNPVCGNNGITYRNPSELSCAQKCGVNVSLARRGKCLARPAPDEGTTATPVTATTASTTFTTASVLTTIDPMSSVVQNCIHKCPTLTPEYNPMCGTNGVTYRNPSEFDCARRCGVNAAIAKTGKCKPVIPSTTSTTVNPMKDPSEEKESCMKTCPVSPQPYPVCGTDGVTYTNPSQLLCARKCGVDVLMVSEGNCPTTTTRPITPTSAMTTARTITTVLPSTTTAKQPWITEDQRKCIAKCPQTPEYYPICGTDGVTYKNPGHLICAAFCGVAVEMQANGPCPVVPTTASPLRPTNDTKIKECIAKCPTKAEYSPVCGSDGQTYQNAGKIICASWCGVDVTIESNGPCRTTTIAPVVPDREKAECMQRCRVTSEYNPVCGTNGVTYGNPMRLICATQCGEKVTVQHKGMCGSPEPTTVKPTSSSYRPLKDNADIQSCLRTCPPASSYNPVCGTDNKLYFNIERLECTRDCGVDVAVQYQGPCSFRNEAVHLS